MGIEGVKEGVRVGRVGWCVGVCVGWEGWKDG